MSIDTADELEDSRNGDGGVSRGDGDGDSRRGGDGGSGDDSRLNSPRIFAGVGRLTRAEILGGSIDGKRHDMVDWDSARFLVGGRHDQRRPAPENALMGMAEERSYE